jgi:hypothetical protein
LTYSKNIKQFVLLLCAFLVSTGIVFGQTTTKRPCSIVARYLIAKKIPINDLNCGAYGSCFLKPKPGTLGEYESTNSDFPWCVAEGQNCVCVKGCTDYNSNSCPVNGYCGYVNNPRDPNTPTKKCLPGTTLSGVCSCKVQCTTQAGSADSVACSDRGCPLTASGKPQQCIDDPATNSCVCKDVDELKPCTVTAPACNGACSKGEVCLPASGSGCECKKTCQKDYTGKNCEGLCLDGNNKPTQNSQCTKLTNGTCDCLKPCGQSSAPSCGGQCNSPNLQCEPKNPNVPELGCACRAIDECEGDVNDHCFDKTCDEGANGKPRVCRFYYSYDEYGQGAVLCGCFYKDEVIEGLPPGHENEKL